MTCKCGHDRDDHHRYHPHECTHSGVGDGPPGALRRPGSGPCSCPAFEEET